MGPWRPPKLRLFSPLLTLLFHEHSRRVFGVLLYAISDSCDTDVAGQVLYKPWVLSVPYEALMPITAIFIPAANCVLLLHQLEIGPVTVHFNVMVLKCTHYTTCITLNVSQTGWTVVSQLGFWPVWWASSLPIKPSRPSNETLMPSVQSRRGNLRQSESKNVDGNTHLALDPLV